MFVDRWLANPRLVRISALLGALAIAFSSILVRLSHASPSTAAIFRCAFALPILGWLALLEERRFGARSWSDRRIGIGLECGGPPAEFRNDPVDEFCRVGNQLLQRPGQDIAEPGIGIAECSADGW